MSRRKSNFAPVISGRFQREFISSDDSTDVRARVGEEIWWDTKKLLLLQNCAQIWEADAREISGKLLNEKLPTI